MKNKRKSKNPPAGSTFHLSSKQEEEEMVLEEGVADVSADLVDAEVEAAQNNLAEMEEEVAKAKEFEDDRKEAAENALVAYKAASDIAMTELATTHPIR